MDDSKKMIGEMVKDGIKENGTSIRQFAETVKMNHPQVFKILKGERNYNIDTLLTVLDALNLEIVIQKKELIRKKE